MNLETHSMRLLKSSLRACFFGSPALFDPTCLALNKLDRRNLYSPQGLYGAENQFYYRSSWCLLEHELQHFMNGDYVRLIDNSKSLRQRDSCEKNNLIENFSSNNPIYFRSLKSYFHICSQF